jgi:DNA-binding Lrp family transcriptional regulator
LDDQQKQLVRRLQDTLPLVDQPFDVLAGDLGWSTDRVLEQINDWRSRGVIRRFGAVVDHRRLGFTANGMAVFRVPDDEIDAAGRLLAGRDEVSHCYRRPPLEGFDYNLFAMVHGTSVEEVQVAVADIVETVAPYEHAVLFSETEYKKVSMKYFV